MISFRKNTLLLQYSKAISMKLDSPFQESHRSLQRCSLGLAAPVLNLMQKKGWRSYMTSIAMKMMKWYLTWMILPRKAIHSRIWSLLVPANTRTDISSLITSMAVYCIWTTIQDSWRMNLYPSYAIWTAISCIQWISYQFQLMKQSEKLRTSSLV